MAFSVLPTELYYTFSKISKHAGGKIDGTRNQGLDLTWIGTWFDDPSGSLVWLSMYLSLS